MDVFTSRDDIASAKLRICDCIIYSFLKRSMKRKEIERETKSMYSFLSSEVTDEVGVSRHWFTLLMIGSRIDCQTPFMRVWFLLFIITRTLSKLTRTLTNPGEPIPPSTSWGKGLVRWPRSRINMPMPLFKILHINGHVNQKSIFAYIYV